MEYHHYMCDLEEHILRRITDLFQRGRKQESLYIREQLHKAQILQLRTRRRPFVAPDPCPAVLAASNIDLAESCEHNGNLFGAELFLEDYLAHSEIQIRASAQLDPLAPLVDDEQRKLVRIVHKLTSLYCRSKKRIERLNSYLKISFSSSDLSSSFISDRAARIDSDQLWIRLYQDSVMDEVFEGAAFFTAAKHNACSLAQFALDRGVSVNFFKLDFHSALHEAIRHRHIDIVKLLIAGGADIESESMHSMTPLHRAASQNGDISVVMFLLWKGARIEARDEYQRTPLHYAVTAGDLDVVRYLLENGARTSAGPRDSLPIHAAAEGGYSGILELLLEHDADVAAQTDKGDTALHFAASGRVKGYTSPHRSRDCIRILLGRGVSVDVRGNHAETALHRASSQHRPDVVKRLFQGGASVRAEADNGTPLHYAIYRVRRGRGIFTEACNVVNLLLDSGSVVNFQRQLDGKTPLHLAAQCVNEDQAQGLKYLRLLLDQGGDVNILDNALMTVVDYLRPNEAAVNWLANYMQGSTI
ncbi:MAG: hypothetical protein Q9208_006872 [Pyrenodesmia sp. 3 TL-2023]